MAFNVLLAGIPFVLLLAAGLGYILNQSPEDAVQIVQAALSALLPARAVAEGTILDPVLADVVRTRALVGFWGVVAFVWFAMRLFTSLRAVLAFVFMLGRDRGYFHGKLVDLYLIAFSVLLMTAWVSLNTWLLVTSGRVGESLTRVGVLEDATGSLGFWAGRIAGLLALSLIFVGLYRWLPRNRTPWRPTFVGAAAATALFELARWLFAEFMRAYSPTSLYTGTLGAIFIVIFWTYYAALMFVIGAEVAHIVELRLIESGALPARSPLTGEFKTTSHARASGAIDRLPSRRASRSDTPPETPSAPEPQSAPEPPTL